MNVCRLAGLVLGIYASAVVAHAQLYLFNVSGSVASLDGSPTDPSITVGAPISFRLTYDLSAPSHSDISGIFYTPLTNTVTVGNFSFAVVDYSQVAPARLYTINGYTSFGYDGATGLSGWLFMFSSHTTLFSHQLPTTAAPIDIFDYQAEISAGGPDWQVRSPITSFEITRIESPAAVPESSTYGFMGAAVMAGLIVYRRKFVRR